MATARCYGNWVSTQLASKASYTARFLQTYLFPYNLRLLGSGGKPISIQGVVTLSTHVGIPIVNYLLFVWDTFQVDYILGTEKKYLHLRNIDVQERIAELMDGSKVPICRLPVSKTPTGDKPVEGNSPEEDFKRKITSNNIWRARQTKLAPHF